MAIRLLPDGTIEVDTPAELAELAEALGIRKQVQSSLAAVLAASPVPDPHNALGDAFARAWERLGERPHEALIALAAADDGLTDVELKSRLGYTAPKNYQLAGTLGAIGKVAAAPNVGLRYSDIIETTRLDTSSRTDAAKYRFRLTGEVKTAVRALNSQ